MTSNLPPEVLAQLREEYLDSFAEILKEIKLALDRGDFAAIENHFHRFVGSGSTYGLPEITVIARAIEYYIKGKKPVVKENIEDGIDLFERVVDAYRKNSPFPSDLKKDVLKKIA